MKAIVKGKPLALALQEIHAECPKADRLILRTTSDALELIGYASHNFSGHIVTVPIGTDAVMKEGFAALDNFSMLYELSRTKEFHACELDIRLRDYDNRVAIVTSYETTVYHAGRRYTESIPAEYSLSTFALGMELDHFRTVVQKSMLPTEPIETAAETPLEVPVKSVTIQSVYLKTYLPRTKHGNVTVASTSNGVSFIVDAHSFKAWHFAAAAQPDRFYIRVPLELLRRAVAAGPEVTIGYLRTDCGWRSSQTVRQCRYKGEPRRSAEFVEQRIGTINGIPFAEQRVYHNVYDHTRQPKTCRPVHYAIGYRDTRDEEVKGKMVAVHGPWHFIREIHMPEWFAERKLAQMQVGCPRTLELVMQWEDWQRERVGMQPGNPIAIEPAVSDHTEWKVLRVRREQARGWKHSGIHRSRSCADGNWRVIVTIDTDKGPVRSYLGEYPEAITKELAKEANWHFAAELLNKTMSRDEVECELLKLRPAKAIRAKKPERPYVPAPIDPKYFESNRMRYQAEAAPMLEIEGLLT